MRLGTHQFHPAYAYLEHICDEGQQGSEGKCSAKERYEAGVKEDNEHDNIQRDKNLISFSICQNQDRVRGVRHGK